MICILEKDSQLKDKVYKIQITISKLDDDTCNLGERLIVGGKESDTMMNIKKDFYFLKNFYQNTLGYEVKYEGE